MNIDWKPVGNVFRIAETVLNLGSAAVSGANAVAGGVMKGAAELLGLGADLIDRGIHPIEHVTRIRSSLGDFDTAANEAETYARTGK
jgi:hypothetical protein